MDKAGIISQRGFEFQKLVFIYNSLTMSSIETAIYEGKDDVELTKDYLPIAVLKSNGDSLIQVKSGEITKSTLQQIFMNWLLQFDKSKSYICFIENSLDIDYKDINFVNELISKIKKTNKNNNSIIRKVKNMYISDFSKMENNLLLLIQNAQFINNNLDEIKNGTFELFKRGFSIGDSDFLAHERFDALIRIFRNEIAESILNKESYRLPHNELIEIISNINHDISDENYDIDYSQFIVEKKDAAKLIMNLNSDSVKQLRLVNSDSSFILKGLTQQIFYEDLRNHFLQLNENAKIDTLEATAYENYSEVLLLNDDVLLPKKIYSETLSRQLNSSIFGQNSAKFFSNGCYIHLTDSSVVDERKIKWGDSDETEE